MTLIATPRQSKRLAWDRILAEFRAALQGQAAHLFGRALALFFSRGEERWLHWHLTRKESRASDAATVGT